VDSHFIRQCHNSQVTATQIVNSSPIPESVSVLLVNGQEFTAATKHTLAKQRVSIMLDGAVLAYFKNKAGDRGYQILINEALRQSMHSEEMEATLRRVIREELRNS
jgi:uncharacterized protein (DUF4415 family)